MGMETPCTCGASLPTARLPTARLRPWRMLWRRAGNPTATECKRATSRPTILFWALDSQLVSSVVAAGWIRCRQSVGYTGDRGSVVEWRYVQWGEEVVDVLALREVPGNIIRSVE